MSSISNQVVVNETNNIVTVTAPGPQLELGVVEVTVGIAKIVAATVDRAELHPLATASTK